MYRVRFEVDGQPAEFSMYEDNAAMMEIFITGLEAKGIDYKVTKQIEVDATWQFKPTAIPKKFLNRLFPQRENNDAKRNQERSDQSVGGDCCGGSCSM